MPNPIRNGWNCWGSWYRRRSGTAPGWRCRATSPHGGKSGQRPGLRRCGLDRPGEEARSLRAGVLMAAEPCQEIKNGKYQGIDRDMLVVRAGNQIADVIGQGFQVTVVRFNG